MKRKIIIFMVIAMTLSTLSMAQDATAISKKSGDMISLSALEMTSTLKIYNEKGNERIRKMATATKKFGDITKMMMKFTEPADVKGTALLVYDYENKNDDMWIYMPALRKSRRIVSSEKGKNFMGSEFTNADMSKPNMTDFNFKITGEEFIDTKKYWIIESTPKTPVLENEYGFSRKIARIDQLNYLTLSMEYYDIGGKLLRIQTIKDYKKQSNGSYFAYYMEMKNLQNGRKSVMTIDQFQPGSSMTEAQFSPAMLEQ